MIAQHEVQHDETMLITHQIRAGAPVLAAAAPGPAPADALRLPSEVLVPGGPFTMGTSTEPWALDNERPAHTVDVAAVLHRYHAGDLRRIRRVHRGRRIRRPPLVDRGRLGAPAAGRAGRAAVLEPGRRAVGPGGVRRDRAGPAGGTRAARVLVRGRRLRPLGGAAGCRPRPSGRRRPGSTRRPACPAGTRGATPSRTASHANLGQRFLRPAPAGSYPDGAAPCGARQLIGDVWEWTSSDFVPYPGFSAWPYREYSEVFFGPEYKVLRGGSFAVSPVACRVTFRNWDYPIRRQIFAGFRTARSAAAETA